MVGSRSGRGKLRCGVRRDKRGQALTRGIDDREVVAHIDRYAAQHRSHIADRRGDFQEVPNDERNAEAGQEPGLPPNAKDTASPASFMPSRSPQRQSLIPRTRLPVNALEYTTRSNSSRP